MSNKIDKLIEEVNEMEKTMGLPQTTEEMLVLNGFTSIQRDCYWPSRLLGLKALTEIRNKQ